MPSWHVKTLKLMIKSQLQAQHDTKPDNDIEQHLAYSEVHPW